MRRKCPPGCTCKRHIFSEKHCRLISENHVGFSGKSHTKEARQRQSTSQKGIPRSVEVKAKIRLGHLGEKFSEERKYNIGLGVAAYMATHNGSFRDTRPELELVSRLQETGLNYERQKRIANMVVDFYLPQQNLVVEVDGCYWHGCEEHCPTSPWPDKFEGRRRRLRELGYDAIRIWEHELVTKGDGPT